MDNYVTISVQPGQSVQLADGSLVTVSGGAGTGEMIWMELTGGAGGLVQSTVSISGGSGDPILHSVNVNVNSNAPRGVHAAYRHGRQQQQQPQSSTSPAAHSSRTRRAAAAPRRSQQSEQQSQALGMSASLPGRFSGHLHELASDLRADVMEMLQRELGAVLAGAEETMAAVDTQGQALSENEAGRQRQVQAAERRRREAQREAEARRRAQQVAAEQAQRQQLERLQRALAERQRQESEAEEMLRQVVASFQHAAQRRRRQESERRSQAQAALVELMESLSGLRVVTSQLADDEQGDDAEFESALNASIAESTPAPRTGPMSSKLLGSLPTFVLSSSGGGSCSSAAGGSGGDHEAEKCSVCLCDHAAGETLRMLPCFHRFHQPCIDKWLGRSGCCPVCKQDVQSLLSVDIPS
eukprot:jgi/Tetstr1/422238/TSEL_013090.t1